MIISMSLARPDVAEADRPDARRTVILSRIVGAGSAVTGESYSQQEVVEAFNITDPKVQPVSLGRLSALNVTAAGQRRTPASSTIETALSQW